MNQKMRRSISLPALNKPIKGSFRRSEETLKGKLFKSKSVFKLTETKQKKGFEIIKKLSVWCLAHTPSKINKERKNKQYSSSFDISNLKPNRFVSEISRVTCNFNQNFDEGIWIGKRLIKSSNPKIRKFEKFELDTKNKNQSNLYHFAIMIRGIVYHEISGIRFENVEISSDPNLKKSFTWHFLTNTIAQTDEIIKTSIRSTACLRYKIVPVWQDQENSVNFANFVLAIATLWTKETCKLKLKKRLGSFFN
jgi:hypothetical protein